MEFTYDKKVDAIHVVFSRGTVAKTLEISNDVFLDVNKNGKPLYLEILNASKKAKSDKKTTKSFLIGKKTFSLNDLISA